MRFRLSCIVILLLLAAFPTLGCSKHSKHRVEEEELSTELRTAPLQIDVFAGRGFLGGSEYERYVLTDEYLWRECGKINSEAKPASQHSPLAGDSVFPQDPSLQLVQRRVEKVSEEQQLRLKVLAAQVFKLNAMNDERAAPPGSVFSLGEPGLFELSIAFGPSKLHVVTSVDAVADKESALLEKAYQLFAGLRGIGPVICEAETFFGVARSH